MYMKAATKASTEAALNSPARLWACRTFSLKSPNLHKVQQASTSTCTSTSTSISALVPGISTPVHNNDHQQQHHRRRHRNYLYLQLYEYNGYHRRHHHHRKYDSNAYISNILSLSNLLPATITDVAIKQQKRTSELGTSRIAASSSSHSNCSAVERTKAFPQYHCQALSTYTFNDPQPLQRGSYFHRIHDHDNGRYKLQSPMNSYPTRRRKVHNLSLRCPCFSPWSSMYSTNTTYFKHTYKYNSTKNLSLFWRLFMSTSKILQQTDKGRTHRYGSASSSSSTLTSTPSSSSPSPSQKDCVYDVRVLTGNVPDAGTRAEVSAQIFGSLITTDPIPLPSTHFGRNTIQNFEIRTDYLGELQKLIIGHDDSDPASSSWFLSGVEICDRPNKRVLVFPCGRWLGPSESADISGPPTQVLYPLENVSLHGDYIPPEGNPPLETPLRMTAGAIAWPHPNKVRQGMRGKLTKSWGYGGEDSYFVDLQSGVFGVADGVYEWRYQDVDAGLYSKRLTQVALMNAQKGLTVPQTIMESAVDQVNKEDIQGSSTMCIARLDYTTGVLHSINLGDSGFMIIRGAGTHGDAENRSGSMVFRSPQQEIIFGCPYQLGHHESSRAPRQGYRSRTLLRPQDFIIMGTDGLFDNLWEKDIISIVNEFAKPKTIDDLKKPHVIQALAAKIMNHASMVSVDKTASTPYSLSASEEFCAVYNGGKQDDITVIVLYIS